MSPLTWYVLAGALVFWLWSVPFCAGKMPNYGPHTRAADVVFAGLVTFALWPAAVLYVLLQMARGVVR